MPSEQHLADAREVVIAGLLMLEGYTVSRPLSGASRYDLVAERDGKFVKIQVKSLKLDGAYADNKHRVYKVEGFSYNPVTKEKKPYTRTEVDVVVGYNHDVNDFAAIPLDSFNGKLSCVVHREQGKTRSEFFNSWKALEKVVNEM